MVNCFAPDCDHHSESHTCKFFRFPTADGEKKRWISLIRYVYMDVLRFPSLRVS